MSDSIIHKAYPSYMPKEELIKLIEDNYPNCSIMHRMYIGYEERSSIPKEDKWIISECIFK